MHKRAEAATPGPWEMDSNDCCVGATGRESQDYWVLGQRTGAHVANMRHAASWHPTVALAVANLLEELADDIVGEGDGFYDLCPQSDIDAALAVARAYLGESA